MKILEELKANGVININSLHKKFGVSKVTIRSDIEELSRKGYLVKTRGGAVTSNYSSLIRLIENTIHEYEEEKKLIAQAAAGLVKPGMRIIVDSGSTTSFLPRHLKDLEITVITNSLLVAQELSQSDNISLIISGGSLRNESQAIVGIPSLAFFSSLNADMMFLGATGFSAAKGVSSLDIMESETKKQMIASSREVFLLMDSSKFGRDSLCNVCRTSELSGIISDSFSENLRKQLIELNVEAITPPRQTAE